MTLRHILGVFFVAVAIVAPGRSDARKDAHRHKPHGRECPSVAVAITGTIDSKRARPGDRFEFVTLETIHVNLKPIVRGTRGAGFIETVSHARGNGRPGYLILDARYLRLGDGRHVPASFAPGSDGETAAYIAAGNTDAPGFLGYTPLVAATSVYNLFHHGKDAALVRGTRVPIIVGDGLSAGTCSVSWMP